MNLPDLPNAGYATKREKELTDAAMFWLRWVERHRDVLLMAVIEGEAVFLPRMMKHWRYLRVDESYVRAVFHYMRLLAGPDPQRQLAELVKVKPFGSRLTPEQAVAMSDNLAKAANG